MKNFILVCTMALCLYGNSQNKITSQELETLIGNWTGTLTYMDYSSNEPYTMPANVTVKPGKNENQLLLFNEYPNEPQANGKSKVTISKDGKAINGNNLLSKKLLDTGETEFTTESEGKDDNKKALIRNIYVVGEKSFIIRKEVKFENKDEWLMRNEFNYSRD
jgi:hypothetical protein